MKTEERVIERLKQSIETMRRFCDDAEREMLGDQRNSIERIERVLRAFSWGMANASTDICAALSTLSRRIATDNASKLSGKSVKENTGGIK